MLFGFFLAIGVAFAQSASDIFYSSERLKRFSGLKRAFLLASVSVPLALIVGFLSEFVLPEREFWFLVTIQASLLALATWLYMKALSLGSVAQTQPILALTTVLLVFTNPLMTDEVISLVGWIGVLTITIGIYLSQFPEKIPGENLSLSKKLIFPFKEMFTQAGVRFKLGVAVIFSVTSNLDRLCLESSNLPTYLLFNGIIMSLILLGAISIVRIRSSRPCETQQATQVDPQPHWISALPGGFFQGGANLLHIWALTFLPVPYVIAFKRLSILLVSGWGFYVRRDRKVSWFRIAGLIAVLVGVWIILLESTW